jgi:hypothetical protein
MTSTFVTMRADRPLDDDAIDRLLAAFGVCTIPVVPDGTFSVAWVDDNGWANLDYVVARATATLVGFGINVEFVRAEVVREGDEAPVTVPELMGVSEVAEVLGVTASRVGALRRTPGFPQPVRAVKATPLWLGWQVRGFAAHWDRTPGRPRRQPVTP